MAIALARHNFRVRRGDIKGAWKLAAFAFAVQVVAWAFRAHHLARLSDEWSLFQRNASESLFWTAEIWLLYMALEPYVRRRWPRILIGWNRILAGQFHDPMIGRDVLVGMLAGVSMLAAVKLTYVLPGWLHIAPAAPTTAVWSLGVARRLLSDVIYQQFVAVQYPLVGLCLLLVLRVLLRSQLVAVGGLVIVTTIAFSVAGGSGIVSTMCAALAATIGVATLLRFGLLAATAAMSSFGVFQALPLTPDVSAWYGSVTIVAVLSALVTAIWAFRTSLAGRFLIPNSQVPNS